MIRAIAEHPAPVRATLRPNRGIFAARFQTLAIRGLV
jgi:hypothetical protein